MTPAKQNLAEALLSVEPASLLNPQLARQIHADVLAQSKHINQPHFRNIHINDLQLLFKAYDARFLDGRCARALESAPLTFRLAKRMTKTAGTTTRFRARDGRVRYEIAIATSLLFDGFGPADREVTVCGLPVADRLEALQRVFEHEFIHLCENLSWGDSNCSGQRFQCIATGLFGHQSHKHALITRGERAAEIGIRPGARVTFPHEGQRLLGVVNRVTKRATVLVEDASGRRFSDGRYYVTYYVPLRVLSLVQAATGKLSLLAKTVQSFSGSYKHGAIR